MHNINFISTLPPQKQRLVQSWLTMTTFISTMLIICGIFLLATQWYIRHNLSQQKNELKQLLIDFDSVMNEQRTIKEKQTILQKKNMKLERYASNPQSPSAVIKTIRSLLAASHIHDIRISKNSMMLTALVRNASEAMNIIAKLNAHDPNIKLTLASLDTKDNDQLLMTAKGTMRL